MVRVVRSTVLDAPVDAVWRIVRDFNGHDRWHPIVERSVLEEGRRTDQIGAVRNFTIRSGERVREVLLSLSDRERHLRYAIVESELPLRDYVAEFRLRPVTDGDRTFWTWSSRFRTPPGEEEALARLVGEAVYEAGFDGVRGALGLRTAAGSGPSRAPPPSTGVPASRAGDDPAPDSAPPPSGTRTTAAASRPGSRSAAGAIEGEAMAIARHGGPEVLRPAATAAPRPGPGEVRIRQTAIGVNYIDVYCRTGYFDLVQPPGTLGMEAAGTVVDVGSGVRHLAPGRRVAYACPPPGAYATVRTMDAALVVPLPDGLDDETAAAVLLKGMSAEFLLHRVHRLEAGQTALVFAPAGGVGRLLCQWAAHLGARVIGATSSDEKARTARAAGAHDVVLPGEASLEDRIMELTRGHGADVIYDGVGRDSFAHSVAALAVRGHLVSYGQASGDIGPFDIGSLAAKSATVSRPNFAHFTDTPEKVGAITRRMFDALEQRILGVEIGARYPLHEAASAHRALEAGETTGSTILLPEGSAR
ncbi:MAG: SRPBCC family protein [Immundisolibacterales bacterium]|nr:SRPBCC family protein [Immundisolibacterales bacterium]